MITTSAVSLAIGLALFAAAFVVALAKTQHRQPSVRPDVVRLRAGDAADHMIPGQPGDDDQFRRWRTLVPHIRRNANAETQASEGERS